jgi:hypothetical protein
MTAVIVTTQGITLTSTGTSVNSIIPADSSNGMPRRIKVTANAVCFVKVGVTTDITATTSDIMVSPGESLRLDVGGCAGIAMISFSGTARLNVVAEELGHWNYVSGDTAIDALAILRRYGTDAHVYLPGIGTLSGLAAGNWQDSGLTTPAVVDGPIGAAVDPLGAINASQSTAGFRPRLERGARNLLTYSQDFTNAAWTKRGTCAISSTPVAGPTGTLNGYAVTGLNSGTNDFYQLSVATAASGNLSPAIWIQKVSTTGTLRIENAQLSTRGQWTIDLSLLGTGWELVGSGHPAVTVVNSAWTSATTDGFMVKGLTGGALAINVALAALFQGTYTAQQILNEGGIPLTTTAAASNPLAGRYSWAFDGVDDRLQLASVPFQMSDDHAVIFAARMDSITGVRSLFSCTGSINQRVAQLFSTNGGGIQASWQDDAGTNVGLSTTCTLGEIFVVSCRKVGNTFVLRKNGTQVGTQTTTLGTTTLTSASIGLSGGFFWNGLIGWGLPLKGTLTDADMLTLERQAAAQFPNGPQF